MLPVRMNNFIKAESFIVAMNPRFALHPSYCNAYIKKAWRSSEVMKAKTLNARSCLVNVLVKT